MAEKYTGLQSVLDAALGPYKNKGFDLIERGGHLTTLFYGDKMVAMYSQLGVTIAEIRRACQEYLDKIEQPVEEGVR